MSNVVCRPFEPVDKHKGAQLIEQLAASAYATGAPWSQTVIERDLGLATSDYWLIEQDGEPLGFISGSQVLDEAEITNIGISAQAQGRGLGRQLLTVWLHAHESAQVITLEVREHNDAARALYQRLGFHAIAVRPNYYSAPSENAVIMQRKVKGEHCDAGT
ncbi:ribosomal protein S18-alanine N-acetyltransferase [Furfurilactobacillus sp. WILCCON 0119]